MAESLGIQSITTAQMMMIDLFAQFLFKMTLLQGNKNVKMLIK